MVKDGGCRVPEIACTHLPDQFDCSIENSELESNHDSSIHTSLWSTRDSSPDSRLDVISSCTSTSISPLPPISPSSSLRSTPPDSPVRKTPIAADSPLLNKTTDPTRRRLRSFTKNLRRAKSFRASREKSVDKAGLQEPRDFRGKEVSFVIKKSLSGRIGWRIMPDDENINLKVNPDILEQVMDRIRNLEFSGEAVPDRMSLKIQ